MIDRSLRRQLIGFYELASGSIGVTATILNAPRLIGQLTPSVRLQAAVLFGCAVLVFALVALAGVLLLRGHPAGSTSTMLAQLVQVISWAAHSTKYSLIAGLYAGFMWTSAGVAPVAGATTSFQLAWSGPIEGGDFVVFNCVPVIVLIGLQGLSKAGFRGTAPPVPPP